MAQSAAKAKHGPLQLALAKAVDNLIAHAENAPPFQLPYTSPLLKEWETDGQLLLVNPKYASQANEFANIDYRAHTTMPFTRFLQAKSPA
jgi:hypothetical protein